MSHRTFARPKKSAFTTIPAKHPASREQRAASLAEGIHLSHDFSEVNLHSGSQTAQQFPSSCPLSFPSPRACPFGGACHTCPAPIQAKLTISQPGDKYEQEADRVADAVMAMPEPKDRQRLQRECSECDDELRRQPEEEEEEEEVAPKLIPRQAEPGGPEEEEEEETVSPRAQPGHTPQVTPAVTSTINALRGRGQPMPPSTRAFFEPRFGHDLSRVRVHADARAADTAKAVKARAFTVGRDVVFGAGQYAPGTHGGRRLLAHELAHVVQQEHSPVLAWRPLEVGPPNGAREHEANWIADRITAESASLACDFTPVQPSIQRVCGSTAIGKPSGCIPLGGVSVFDISSSSDELYLFHKDCDEFKPGEEARLKTLPSKIGPSAVIDIHGFASEEGPADFNGHLSCARALKAKSMLTGAGLSSAIIGTIYKHGATPGPRREHRSAVIPLPVATPTAVCGPDATDWFIQQVAKAKVDKKVLAVKADLAQARGIAAQHGFSAERFAEGGIAMKVLVEWRRAGSPSLTPEARAQLVQSFPGLKALAQAVVGAKRSPKFGRQIIRVILAIMSAAQEWKALVGTGAKFDFKNDPRTMQGPTSPNCPANCSNTITLCPSSGPDCFLTEVPGNLFFAHVGRFVGWTELALQLGSEFAQLASTRTWDLPEDTRMISIGFALPHPLTRSAFCAALATNRASFTLRPCDNCWEPTGAAFV